MHLYDNRHAYACEGSDASLCNYEQTSNGSFPAFTAVDNSVSNTVVFTGTNFFTRGFVANSSYGGVDADTVTVDSATQVTAVWTLGMPPLGQDLIPELWFESTTTDTVHYAYTTDTRLTINKQLGTATGPTGLECSFAGGCHLEIQADALSSILKNDTVNNYVSVCDEKCEFIEESSDATKSVCKIPKMSTVYSNE